MPRRSKTSCSLRALRLRPRLAARLMSCMVVGWLVASAPGTAAQGRFDDVEITATPVSGAIHMLTGAGGNIAVSIGDDGVLIVDDQFLPLAERIQAAIDALGGAAPQFVLNTHYHGDHVGGNPHFGQTGAIIAHHNVRVRLLEDASLPAAALPSVTFAKSLSLHFNGDDIRLMHLPAGHTDGDSAVWFTGSNVLHLGDQLFNGGFPYVDLAAGGTVAGYIANLEAVLEWAPPDVKVIPGHGALGGLDAVRAAVQVLRETRQVVADALGKGATVDAVVATGLGPEYASWGAGFINEERWIRTLAADMAMPSE